MNKGFTLLELIIVIIIVGILATLGFVQYASVIERGRFAEARANLGTLRQLQVARIEDPMHSALGYGNLEQLGTGLPGAANADYYFIYSCVPGLAAVPNAGTCTATRCAVTDACKATPPTTTAGCTFTLSPAGAMGGNCP